MAQKTYFGVDLSEHNFMDGKNVKFSVLKKKVDFIILRIGWAGNGKYHLDLNFESAYSAAKKAGIPVGAYVYMYSKTPAAAKKGAKWALKQLKGKTLDIPYVFCDMEDGTIAGLGKETLTAITKAFCDTIEAGGYRGCYYCNPDWLQHRIDKNKLKGYELWLAYYVNGDKDKYRGKCDMWQNSPKGKVSGVYNKNGTLADVDTNYMYTKLFASKPIVVQPVTPGKPTIKYYPKYTGKSVSIVDALKSLKIDASKDNRKRIATRNGIKAYVGTAAQNTKMLKLLKAGKLIKSKG